jgi:hypothetical protein
MEYLGKMYLLEILDGLKLVNAEKMLILRITFELKFSINKHRT